MSSSSSSDEDNPVSSSQQMMERMFPRESHGYTLTNLPSESQGDKEDSPSSDEDSGPKSIFNFQKPFHVPGKNKNEIPAMPEEKEETDSCKSLETDAKGDGSVFTDTCAGVEDLPKSKEDEEPEDQQETDAIISTKIDTESAVTGVCETETKTGENSSGEEALGDGTFKPACDEQLETLTVGDEKQEISDGKDNGGSVPKNEVCLKQEGEVSVEIKQETLHEEKPNVQRSKPELYPKPVKQLSDKSRDQYKPVIPPKPHTIQMTSSIHQEETETVREPKGGNVMSLIKQMESMSLISENEQIQPNMKTSGSDTNGDKASMVKTSNADNFEKLAKETEDGPDSKNTEGSLSETDDHAMLSEENNPTHVIDTEKNKEELDVENIQKSPESQKEKETEVTEPVIPSHDKVMSPVEKKERLLQNAEDIEVSQTLNVNANYESNLESFCFVETVEINRSGQEEEQSACSSPESFRSTFDHFQPDSEDEENSDIDSAKDVQNQDQKTDTEEENMLGPVEFQEVSKSGPYRSLFTTGMESFAVIGKGTFRSSYKSISSSVSDASGHSSASLSQRPVMKENPTHTAETDIFNEVNGDPKSQSFVSSVSSSSIIILEHDSDEFDDLKMDSSSNSHKQDSENSKEEETAEIDSPSKDETDPKLMLQAERVETHSVETPEVLKALDKSPDVMQSDERNEQNAEELPTLRPISNIVILDNVDQKEENIAKTDSPTKDESDPQFTSQAKRVEPHPIEKTEVLETQDKNSDTQKSDERSEQYIVEPPPLRPRSNMINSENADQGNVPGAVAAPAVRPKSQAALDSLKSLQGEPPPVPKKPFKHVDQSHQVLYETQKDFSDQPATDKCRKDSGNTSETKAVGQYKGQDYTEPLHCTESVENTADQSSLHQEPHVYVSFDQYSSWKVDHTESNSQAWYPHKPSVDVSKHVYVPYSQPQFQPGMFQPYIPFQYGPELQSQPLHPTMTEEVTLKTDVADGNLGHGQIKENVYESVDEVKTEIRGESQTRVRESNDDKSKWTGKNTARSNSKKGNDSAKSKLEQLGREPRIPSPRPAKKTSRKTSKIKSKEKFESKQVKKNVEKSNSKPLERKPTTAKVGQHDSHGFEQQSESTSDQGTGGTPERSLEQEPVSMEPIQEQYILLAGINPETTNENFKNFIEAASKGVDVILDKIIFDAGRNNVLIVVEGKLDIEKVKHKTGLRGIDRKQPSVHLVPEPTCIAVSSKDVDLDPSSLLDYFENRKVGGGDLATEHVREAKDCSCYIYQFKDTKVVRRLCEREEPHVWNKEPLYVSPYYESEAGDIWDQVLHKVPIPEPFSIKENMDVVQFLRRECCSNIHEHMKQSYSTIQFGEDTVTFTCTLTPTVENFRTLIKTWKEKSKEIFMEYKTQYILPKSFANDGKEDRVWIEFEKICFSDDFQMSSVLVTKGAGHTINLIGIPHVVEEKLTELENTLTKIDKVVRREKKTQRIQSEQKLKLAQGMQQVIGTRQDFPMVYVSFAKKEVKYEGLPEEIVKIEEAIYEAMNEIKTAQRPWKWSDEFAELIQRKQIFRGKIDDSFKSSTINAEWDVDKNKLKVWFYDTDEAEVFQVIENQLLERKIQIAEQDLALFDSQEWIEFVNEEVVEIESVEVNTDYVRRHKSVTIYGLNAQVQEIEKKVADFIEKNGMRWDEIRCGQIHMKFIRKYNGDLFHSLDLELKQFKVKITTSDDTIKVQGNKEGLKRAKRKLKEELEKIKSEKVTFKNIGVKEIFAKSKSTGTITEIERNTRCLVQEAEELERGVTGMDAYGYGTAYSRGAAEDSDSDDGGFLTHSSSAAGRTKGFNAKNGLSIQVVRGEIGNQKGDVVVAASTPTLNLSTGAATKSLLSKGGQDLQKECNDKHPGGVKNGEIASIDSKGSLAFKKVYLTALPSFSQEVKSKKLLQDVVQKSLELAMGDKMAEVDFCAMGTGQLKYPAHMVAATMFQAAIDFDSKHQNSSIKEVKFVLYHKDMSTIQAFEEELRERVEGGAVQQCYILKEGNMQMEMVVENLAEQTTDVILCTTAPSMDLTKSGAAKSLLKFGGQTLQDECKTKYKSHLEAGQIAEISGGKLRCKHVFLTVLPSYSAETSMETLTKTIEQSLSLAHQRDFKSIAMPALGLGFLKYPQNETCRQMLMAVQEWSIKNSSSRVQNVRFVMYAKDYKLIQTFKSQIMSMQGKGRRDTRKFSPTSFFQPHQKQSSKYYVKENKSFQLHHVTLSVKTGDILAEHADAIVCSTDRNFTFQGAVAQTLLKKCPDMKDQCDKKKHKIKDKEVVCTISKGIPAKNVLHVAFQDSDNGWKTVMKAALEKAEHKKCKTIAFPVLGSGQGSRKFSPEIISSTLFNAIVDFCENKMPKTLKEVRLVVFEKQSGFLEPIVSEIHRKIQTAAVPEGGFIHCVKKLYAGAKKGLFGSNEPEVLNEEKKNSSELQVCIYSEEKKKIAECKCQIEAIINKAVIKKVIENYKELVPSLKDQEIEAIESVPYVVEIKVDKQNGVITIRGPAENVSVANDSIQQELRRIDRHQRRVEKAKLLTQQVKWYYENVTVKSIELNEYDMHTNLSIEEAYKKNEKTYQISDTDGNIYVIDFEKLTEYPISDSSDTVRVMRKDILKSGSTAIPKEWTAMKDNENIRVVALKPTDQVYKDIEKEFLTQTKSGKYTNRIQFDVNKLQVTKIERIQNKTLYQQYMAKKKLMTAEKGDKLPPNMPIERTVWHGTKNESITSIQTHGFNRSYCGVNGIWFGAGVYFAGDASYSARGWLSGAGGNAPQASPVKGTMFYVKALTGQYCKGNQSMRYLPPIDPSKPLVLYDSAVDDPANPIEFVIFHDTQAYPEYLITFAA